jgi:hypothetical protein
MAEFKAVTFYQGAPIDPSQLNQLQTNITEAWTASNNLLNLTTGGSTKSTIPFIYADTTSVPMKGGRGEKDVSFNGQFQTVPNMVACLGINVSTTNTVFSVASKVTGANTAKIYVNSSDKEYAKSITVNFIAVENREVARP